MYTIENCETVCLNRRRDTEGAWLAVDTGAHVVTDAGLRGGGAAVLGVTRPALAPAPALPGGGVALLRPGTVLATLSSSSSSSSSSSYLVHHTASLATAQLTILGLAQANWG